MFMSSEEGEDRDGFWFFKFFRMLNISVEDVIKWFSFVSYIYVNFFVIDNVVLYLYF